MRKGVAEMLPFSFYTIPPKNYCYYMKVEINVPSSLSEITLEQYQKFAKVNTEENQDTSFLMHKMVEIFCNLELRDIAKIKYNYIKSVLSTINDAFDVDHKLITTFKLDGVEYGFIPVLDEMTLGEYIDLDTNFSDWQNMHKAMAVLYRPIEFKKGERYTIKEYTAKEDAMKMKQMPLDIVMGCMSFFLTLNSELLTTTLNYLEKTMDQEMTTLQLSTLQENGATIKASMRLVREMLPDLTKLPN